VGELENKVVDKVAELFDLKVLDLCVGGWKKYKELQEFADPKKHPEENELALLEHEIVSTHHPTIEVSLAG